MIRACLAAAAVAALLLSSPAKSAECMSIDALQAAAATQGFVVRALTGAQIERAAQIYNLTPPVSNLPIDSAAYAEFPNNGGGVIVVGPGTSLCANVRVPPGRWQATIQYLLHGDAT